MALLFDSESSALAAVATINANMGLGGDGDVTQRWDVPREDTNGKWVIAKPEERFLAGVTGYVEGEATWPPGPGMGSG